MHLKKLALLASIFTGFLLTSAGVSSERNQPNILFIMADDLGVSDLGSYGSDYYRTPHLDALAKEGIRFTSAYSASTVCSPTRASVLTGRYPHRVQITDALPWDRLPENPKLIPPNHRKALPGHHATYAKALRAAGYHTAMFGKWHLGNEYDFYAQGGHYNYGFDEVYGADYEYINEVDKAVEVLTKEALRFLEENKDRPFILSLFHHTPHVPLACPPKYEARYDDIPKGEIHNNQTYAGLMTHMDDSVQALLDKLEELGLTESTVVIFTSDNGGLGSETSNLPFRGGKGDLYEGGVRVPLIIRWPGVIEPGVLSDVPVHSADYFPTFLEMAGVPLMLDAHMDGRSMMPLLKQEGGFGTRDLFWHLPHYRNDGPQSAVRSGDWKLLHRIEAETSELFNLADDPAESHDLADERPEITRRLATRLETHLDQSAAMRMRPNPKWDSARPRGKNWNHGVFYPKHGGTFIVVKDRPYPPWFNLAEQPK